MAPGMKLSVSGMLPEGAVISTEAPHAIQAVTLADGSTAYIQQPKGMETKLLVLVFCAHSQLYFIFCFFDFHLIFTFYFIIQT